MLHTPLEAERQKERQTLGGPLLLHGHLAEGLHAAGADGAVGGGAVGVEGAAGGDGVGGRQGGDAGGADGLGGAQDARALLGGDLRRRALVQRELAAAGADLAELGGSVIFVSMYVCIYILYRDK